MCHGITSGAARRNDSGRYCTTSNGICSTRFASQGHRAYCDLVDYIAWLDTGENRKRPGKHAMKVRYETAIAFGEIVPHREKPGLASVRRPPASVGKEGLSQWWTDRWKIP